MNQCQRRYRPRTAEADTFTGHVVRNQGPAAAVAGLSAPVGSLVEIGCETAESIAGEVVGFHEELTLVCPLGDLDDVRRGSCVRLVCSPRFVRTGTDLLGRTVNALGAPVDGGAQVQLADRVPVLRCAAPDLDSPRVNAPLATGIRAIDGLLPCGFGQRMGIFYKAPGDKDRLLAMLARHGETDVNVIASIGVRELDAVRILWERVGAQRAHKTIVIVAADEEPALVRLEAAATAAALAAYFRDRGCHVFLAIDSLTAFAAAQREIGVAGGESLDASGYPASLCSALPRLLQRGGQKGGGSITGFYTVAQESNSCEGPICEMVRSLLDGHLVLDHALDGPDRGPAIELARSVSRPAHAVADREHLNAINRLCWLLTGDRQNAPSTHDGPRPRIQDGPVERATGIHAAIAAYMRQEWNESCTASQARQALLELAQQQRPARAA